MSPRQLLRRVGRAWALIGSAAIVAILLWTVLANRANSEARAALQAGPGLLTATGTYGIAFQPEVPADVGLIILPGALVDPVAYAPLAHAAAKAGFPAIILRLPWRGLGSEAEVRRRLALVMNRPNAPSRWLLAGHSRGGEIASRLLAGHDAPFAGLLLMGTSHPRDVNLSGLQIPVTKIVATRDGLARPDRVRANAKRLPPQTQWVWIDGGNHSQFGWYGFQPGDRFAHISADDQHAVLIGETLATLRRLPQ